MPTVKARIQYDKENDVFSVTEAYPLGSKVWVEHPLDGPVTEIHDLQSKELLGWAVYGLKCLFRQGSFSDCNHFIPESLNCFEIDEDPGQAFSLPELLQWAYDHLVTLKHAA